LEVNAEPRSERPWPGADEDADRLKVLERMTRHVVEQIELARDFDAREGKGAECQASRQRRHFIEGKQHAADRQG
jgi:hypothetical protein